MHKPIYGSAAANGVILITTKLVRKTQKEKIAYNTHGSQEASRTLPTLNASMPCY
jgi:hypothetical protein